MANSKTDPFFVGDPYDSGSYTPSEFKLWAVGTAFGVGVGEGTDERVDITCPDSPEIPIAAPVMIATAKTDPFFVGDPFGDYTPSEPAHFGLGGGFGYAFCRTVGDSGSTVSAAGFFWGDALVAGNLEFGSTTRDEISGFASCLKTGNLGSFIACDDSLNTLYVIGPNGEARGDITLTGATLTDAEAVEIFDYNGTKRVIVGAFGDNGGVRATKQLFIFDEPDITDSNITIPNDGSWEQVDFVFPATPLWAGGSNMGDVETMFVVDDKIYLVSKREAIPKLFSIPVQASYTGTQTATYEGEVYDIPDSGGVPVTPGNAVDGCVSHDGLNVLIKTYDTIWGWSRGSTDLTIPELLATAPDEYSYVGLGSHPASEPQGESITFSPDDTKVYHVSETGTGSTATNFPLFVMHRSNVVDISTATLQEGVTGYTGCIDTYIQQGSGEGTTHGTETSFVVDKNVSDERFGLLKFDAVSSYIGANATIVGAALELNISSEGISFDVFHITNPDKEWDENSTWTSLGGMVTGTDTESLPMGRSVALDTRTGIIQLAIDPDAVQLWYDSPTANLGMFFVGTDNGGDGIQFDSSEHLTSSLRPKLIVQYNPDPDYIAPESLSFQDGDVNAYAGTLDTFIDTDAPDTNNGSAVSLVADFDAPSRNRRILLRFDDIVGVGATQIPTGSTVTSVQLQLYINTEGQRLAGHRMLVTWDESSTHNSLTGGVSLDDVDAASVGDFDTTVRDDGSTSIDTYIGFRTITSESPDNATGLVDTVQAWVDGETNYGWVLTSITQEDGLQIDSAEGATQARKPKLIVTFTPPA